MSIPVVEGRRFRLGKYEVVGKPIPQSAHMLRYTVFVDGIRIGALASVPTQSDCRFSNIPGGSAAKDLFGDLPPGPPEKGHRAACERSLTPPVLELPHEIALPRKRDSE